MGLKNVDFKGYKTVVVKTDKDGTEYIKVVLLPSPKLLWDEMIKNKEWFKI